MSKNSEHAQSKMRLPYLFLLGIGVVLCMYALMAVKRETTNYIILAAFVLHLPTNWKYVWLVPVTIYALIVETWS